MTLREILRNKGSIVHSISPCASLYDVSVRLVEHHCGSLVVCDERGPRRTLLGIITERDLLGAAAANRGTLVDLCVVDYMTTALITAHPDDTVEDVMGVMTEQRIRHLPVLDGDELVGLVSIGDVVKAQHDLAIQENYYLKSYIQS
jgi:CBS domain-containing protein